MFDFIGNFFSGSWARIRLTALEIQYALIIVGALTIVGILPPFLGTPIEHSFYLAGPIAAFSIYRLCGLSRYMTTYVAGELGEIAVDVCDKNFKNQSLLDNELAATYRKLIVFVLMAQSSIFVLAAVAFNHLDGSRIWLPAMIIIFFLISLAMPRFSLWTFGAVTAASIIFILAIAIHDTIPSVSRVPGVSQVVAKIKTNEIASKNARALEDIGVTREKQRQAALSEVINKVAQWQEENRGQEPPKEFEEEMEATKIGLTLAEYRHSKMSKEELIGALGVYTAKGGDVNMLHEHCRKVWVEYQTQLAAEVAAKKAEAERAETEARAKAEAQTKTVQPQEETAKQFSFMEIQKLDGTSYQNRIVLVKMDQNCVEFTQIWGNGHSIKYSGQKAGESFFGNYRHTVDGRIEEGKFELNSKTLEGKFERPGNAVASFRLI